MKRCFIVLTLPLLVFGLAGCGNNQPPAQTSAEQKSKEEAAKESLTKSFATDPTLNKNAQPSRPSGNPGPVPGSGG